MVVKDFMNEKYDSSIIMSKKNTIAFLLKILKPNWIILTFVIIITILTAALELGSIALIFPLLNSLNGSTTSTDFTMPITMLDSFFTNVSDIHKIRIIAISLLILQIAKLILLSTIKIGIAKIQVNVDKRLRLLVINDLLSCGMEFINKTSNAENFTILNAFTGHTGRLSLAITSVINPLIMVLVYIFALMTISWQLTLISATLISISTYFMGRISKKVSAISTQRNRAAVTLNQLGFETISALKQIQLFTKEKDASKKYELGTSKVNRLIYKNEKLRAISTPFYQIANLISVVMLLILATIIFANNETFILGIILTYLFVMIRLIGPLSALNTQRIQIAGLIPSMNSLQYFLERNDKKHYKSGSKSPVVINNIKIHDLSFKYDKHDKYILKNIDLEIDKGTFTAIVGPSGSGKSTLTNLLLRLYEPSTGLITANQINIEDINLNHWRSTIGTVSQSTFIFNDTIENNIKFANPDATPIDIIEAAKKANAHDFISEMKDGYQTIVGDQGVRLSGGESQRISIARTILYNPQILILDEATSSLDAESEKLVQKAIDNLSVHRTVIAIAHRLSTIKEADRIIVLDNGMIAENGTHDELMKEQNLYYSYIKLQSVEIK